MNQSCSIKAHNCRIVSFLVVQLPLGWIQCWAEWIGQVEAEFILQGGFCLLWNWSTHCLSLPSNRVSMFHSWNFTCVYVCVCVWERFMQSIVFIFIPSQPSLLLLLSPFFSLIFPSFSYFISLFFPPTLILSVETSGLSVWAQEDLLTGTWGTLQWLHQWRKWQLFPANSSSGRVGASGAPPSPSPIT